MVITMKRIYEVLGRTRDGDYDTFLETTNKSEALKEAKKIANTMKSQGKESLYIYIDINIFTDELEDTLKVWSSEDCEEVLMNS